MTTEELKTLKEKLTRLYNDLEFTGFDDTSDETEMFAFISNKADDLKEIIKTIDV